MEKEEQLILFSKFTDSDSYGVFSREEGGTLRLDQCGLTAGSFNGRCKRSRDDSPGQQGACINKHQS